MSHPGTDQAERLRRRLWYFNVRMRSGQSDYQLSQIFDLNLAGVSRRSNGNARRRIFERLRTHDEMPFRGRTAEFVHMVDQHSDFRDLRGTANLYLSPFWELIGKKPLNIDSLRSLILRSARGSNLLFQAGQLNDQEELVRLFSLVTPEDRLEFLRATVDHYELALEAVLPTLDKNLDSLALLGGLYREAYYAGQLHFALMLEGYFGDFLQDVMDCEWVPVNIKDELFQLAVERVLTVSFLAKDLGRGYLEQIDKRENPGSPIGMLLARHDRLLWGIYADDPYSSAIDSISNLI